MSELSPFARTRLAPTPSGYLHRGNGFSFALAALLARRAGAALLLRIDDIDRGRYRPRYLQDIFETLDWMGIAHTEGPRDAAAFERHWSQHRHLERYQQLLEHLTATGQVYACRCSRREIRARSKDGSYSGTCRRLQLPLDLPGAAWRVHVPPDTLTGYFRADGTAAEPLPLADRTGDFVIRGKNGLPAYQVVSLADDLHYGCDFIVRGEDLLDSTLMQQYLARLIGASAFAAARFLHHPLVTAPDGSKLSKSAGAAALRQWRAEGRSAAELWAAATVYLATVG